MSLRLLAIAAFVATVLVTPSLRAASGGPVGGYSFGDQAEGVVFNYVDISNTGALIATGDNTAGTASFPAGVTFSFYGTAYSQLRLATNGYISTDLTDAGPDSSNDCPIPASPSSGGGARIYALHDDLITDVYYQYFNSAQAASIGFPGQTYGISIVQWTGSYFSDGLDLVDAQAVLFHGTGQILVQTLVVDQGGSSSTTGVQSLGATTGLMYSCDTAASMMTGSAVMLSPVALSEVRLDQTGDDDDEYFELIGAPGVDLSSLTVVVLGDGAPAAGSGVIEAAVTLTAESVGPSGYFVAAESSFTIGTADLVTSLNFENSDNVTLLLVQGFTGAAGDDLDTDDDGTLEVTPWTSVLDVIALIEEQNPPINTEYHYGPPTVGPDGGFTPGHALSCAGGWQIGDFDPSIGVDSPGAVNECSFCGNGIVDGSEQCDGDGLGTPGETATCDNDCSLAECGDGTLNATAGEGCDDGNNLNDDDCPDDPANGGTCQPASCGDGFVDMEGSQIEECDGDGIGTPGETATCDLDCTAAMCGDSTVNMTALEDCDDGGETATCDLDCTTATCGDSTVNNTAGETCDDGGRSTTCNLNCTAASCGDGVVNMTAGEECDGDGAGNPGETATCDLDCTDAICGDAEINATSGEICDDGMETATCDSDCTPAECGDMTVNAAAGEECDDGNTIAGDGCDASCLNEGTGGAGGAGVGGSSTVGVGGGTSSAGGSGPIDDGSNGVSNDEGGCSCRTPGGHDDGGKLALLSLLGLVLAIRRRRR